MENKTLKISSGARWEPIVGYSRAVRVGNVIEVAGTTAVRNGQLIGVGDAYQQAVVALEIIMEAIEKAGGRPEHVVRTRIYVTDIRDWEAVGRAHGEVFSEIRPATSLIEVSKFVSPEMLVEIEATAIISE